MTYTVTTTFTLNNGDNITTREEWIAFLTTHIPEPNRSNFRDNLQDNMNLVSLNHEYNGNEVVRTIVWASEAANTAHNANSDTIAVLAALDSVPNVIRASVGATT